MEGKKQKVSQIRKKEILDAAKRVFLRKGFADTVMEDIIVETSLSRGGVYYHYKNKVEILHDLMRVWPIESIRLMKFWQSIRES